MVRFNLHNAITQLIGVKKFYFPSAALGHSHLWRENGYPLSLSHVKDIFASYCWNSNFGRAARGVWSICTASSNAWLLASCARNRKNAQPGHLSLNGQVRDTEGACKLRTTRSAGPSRGFSLLPRISMRRRASLSAHQERAKGSYRETHFLSLRPGESLTERRNLSAFFTLLCN